MNLHKHQTLKIQPKKSHRNFFKKKVLECPLFVLIERTKFQVFQKGSQTLGKKKQCHLTMNGKFFSPVF